MNSELLLLNLISNFIVFFFVFAISTRHFWKRNSVLLGQIPFYDNDFTKLDIKDSTQKWANIANTLCPLTTVTIHLHTNPGYVTDQVSWLPALWRPFQTTWRSDPETEPLSKTPKDSLCKRTWCCTCRYHRPSCPAENGPGLGSPWVTVVCTRSPRYRLWILDRLEGQVLSEWAPTRWVVDQCEDKCNCSNMELSDDKILVEQVLHRKLGDSLNSPPRMASIVDMQCYRMDSMDSFRCQGLTRHYLS